jgi:hypothetical protein
VFRLPLQPPHRMDRTQHPPLAVHSHPPEALGLSAAQRTAPSRPIGTHSDNTDAGRNSPRPLRASVPPGYRLFRRSRVPQTGSAAA